MWTCSQDCSQYRRSIDDMQQEVRPLSRGRINLTVVGHPPEDFIVENPTSHLKVLSPCYETFAPLMKKVVKSYSPVHSKYYIISVRIFFLNFIQIIITKFMFWTSNSGLLWGIIMLW